MENRELTLTTYKRVKSKKVIDKVYKSTTYDINFGVVEDIAEALETITFGSNNDDILKMILKNIKNVKPLLFDIFDGLTEEQLRTADTKEIVKIVYNIMIYAINELNSVVTPKN